MTDTVDRTMHWTCAAVLLLAVGCGPAGTTTGPVTWWRDIAPIAETYCNGCHREGGIGPFPLNSYDEAGPRAPLIAAMTESRRMPPWPPAAAGCRPLQNPRVLTDAQIALIRRWSDMGAPEGNRADYVAPTQRMDPFPPTGDITVQPADPYLPRPVGNDDYHCFILDPQLTATRDVIGFRVTPGNGAIVHHMLLFEVRQAALAQLQTLDDGEPGPGYTCFGGPRVSANLRAAPAGSGEVLQFDEQQIGGWAPGSPPTPFPAGTGIRLAAGSRLVMQVHYNVRSTSAGMTDRPRVDLYLSPTPVVSQAMWVPEAQTRFTIPAGAAAGSPSAQIAASPTNWSLPLRLWGIAPHMHMRGRSIRVDLAQPTGTTECLVNIPNWNFHWQQAYWYVAPLRTQALGPGRTTQTTLRCGYDNSQANQPVIDGMQAAPHDLHWGEGSDDEMCLDYHYVTF